MKTNITIGIILILVVIAIYGFAPSSSMDECEKKGGIAVGQGRIDCWDSVNKTFIKSQDK